MDYQAMRDVNRHRRNRAAAPIGALVLVLAAAGIVALVWLGVNLTHRIYDNSSEKEKFSEIVQPVLMFDPPTFDDIGMLDNQTLLESALWATMLGEKRDTYTFDAQSNLLVPASDVDVVAARLFGPSVTLEHGSFPSDFGISYYYNETSKTYSIPVANAPSLYTARVDEIVRNGDEYELLVGYISPSTAWTANEVDASEQLPHKYMIYRLTKVGSGYRLLAIEEPPTEKQIRYNAQTVEGEIASIDESLLGETGEESETGSNSEY